MATSDTFVDPQISDPGAPNDWGVRRSGKHHVCYRLPLEESLLAIALYGSADVFWRRGGTQHASVLLSGVNFENEKFSMKEIRRKRELSAYDLRSSQFAIFFCHFKVMKVFHNNPSLYASSTGRS